MRSKKIFPEYSPEIVALLNSREYWFYSDLELISELTGITTRSLAAKVMTLEAPTYVRKEIIENGHVYKLVGKCE